MREPLRRIAAGEWSETDLDSIEAQLDETAEQVEKNIRKLKKYRDRLREKFGEDAAAKVDSVTNWSDDTNADGKDKPWLRNRLENLVRNARAYDYSRVDFPPEDREYMEDQKKWIEDTASWLASEIENLNSRITEIHNLVMPPTNPASTATAPNSDK